jgi:hypothetical protein
VWAAVTVHTDTLGVPVTLRALCWATAERLPVSGVAVSVRGGLVISEVLCAIGVTSREPEELQLTVGEGPSLEVLAGSPPVLVGNLDSAEQQARWSSRSEVGRCFRTADAYRCTPRWSVQPEIHQAAGMISVQLGVGIEAAYSSLRARAFAQERPLSELAADVVARRLRFNPEDTT